MKNDKKVVYLARTFGRRSAENFEDFLAGKSVQIGSKRDDLVITETVQAYDTTKSIKSVKDYKYQLNAKKTAEVNSYFFVGDSIEEVLENIEMLSQQPKNQEAYDKIEEGRPLSSNDLLGSNKVSMCVIAVDSEYLDDLVEQGYAEMREGTYGTDSEKFVTPEIVVGDDGLKNMIKDEDSAEIVVYDEIHSAFESLGQSYDNDGLFGYSYQPEFRVNNVGTMDWESEGSLEQDNSQNSQGVVNAKTKAWQDIKDMYDSGILSDEDYQLMISALGDVPDSGFDIPDDSSTSKGDYTGGM